MPKTLTFDPGRTDLQPARLYQFQCRDGTTTRLTDADHDVVIDPSGTPVTYVHLDGVSFSELNFSDDARSNLAEVSPPLVAGGLFDPTDVVVRKKFRSAVVGVRLCDLSDVSASGWVFGGIIADQTLSEDGQTIKFEIRSDLALAKTLLVETFGALCRAKHGDYVNPSNPGRCKLPVKPDDIIRSHIYAVGDYVRVRSGVAGNPLDYANRRYRCTVAGETDAVQPDYATSGTVVGNSTIDGAAEFIAEEAWLRTVTVASIPGPYTFTISDPADARAVDGYFALGWIAINGLYRIGYDVRAYTAATRTVKTWPQIDELLQVGDIIDIAPGCDRRRVATCAGVFDNVVNNRSED
jgi:hypothetical protein